MIRTVRSITIWNCNLAIIVFAILPMILRHRRGGVFAARQLGAVVFMKHARNRPIGCRMQTEEDWV